MEGEYKPLNNSDVSSLTTTSIVDHSLIQKITSENMKSPMTSSKKLRIIEEIYPQYPGRFLALIGFGLGSAMNGIVWISLVAVTDEVKNAFGVSEFFLNM